jgi:hypothetical protein
MRPPHGLVLSVSASFTARAYALDIGDRSPMACGRPEVPPASSERTHLPLMHVILMDILTSHGGWLCVEKEVVQIPALDACLTRSRGPSGEPVLRLGVPLLDDYLEFLAGRCRPNTVLAAAYDLRVFFTIVAKSPDEVCAADVLGFITAQRTGRVGAGSWCSLRTWIVTLPGC